MHLNSTDILQWWRKKRLKYNQALLFTGLMGFAIQAAVQPFKGSIPLPFWMRLSGVAFAIFLVLANIAFTAGYISDLVFNNQNSLSFRERLFFIGYWFAISALTACIIAFLIIA